MLIFPQIATKYRALYWLFSQKVIFSSKCPCISSTILTFFPKIPVCFYNKNSHKVNFSSNCAYNTVHFIDFSPKKSVFSSKWVYISSTILTFLPNNPLCFYTKNSQKVHFPSKCAYNTGHFIDFSPKKSDFFSKCACISCTLLIFLPNNPTCFYTKNSQEFHFPSNCAYHTGHFIDVSPKKSNFFIKMRLHIEHNFDFFAQ